MWNLVISAGYKEGEDGKKRQVRKWIPLKGAKTRTEAEYLGASVLEDYYNQERVKSVILNQRRLECYLKWSIQISNMSLECMVTDEMITAASRGCVYFVQSTQGGLIKIGVATELKKRLKGLQSMCPIPLVCLGIVPGYAELEQSLHTRFAMYRRHGEWFEPSDELLTYIRENAICNNFILFRRKGEPSRNAV